MDKEKIKNILSKLDFWLNEDRKLQEALGLWTKSLAPSSFVPIIEPTLTRSFIDGVSQIIPELGTELEYYAYELPTMGKAEGIINGKKYNLKNQDDYIDFILINLQANK